MNEEITKMSLLITHLDVSTETKEKLYTQNYKIATEIERLNNIIDELEKWVMEDVKDKKPDLYFQVLRKVDILDKLKELKGSDKDGNNKDGNN